MTEQQAIDYKNKKTWFCIGLQYFHENSVRTAYFRGRRVQDAIRRFEELSQDPADMIFNVWLFDDEDLID